MTSIIASSKVYALLVFTSLTTASLSLSAQAQNTGQIPKSTLSIEIDPAPFVLKGYSFSLRYSPKTLSHWSVMGSVYKSSFPNKMMKTENRDQGFRNLKFKNSYALFVDYALRKNGKGLLFGPSVFLYNNTVQHDDATKSTCFQTIYPNFRVGYTLFPIKKIGLYVTPWVNAGKEVNLDKRNQIGDVEFKTAKVKFIAALHIGYRFSF
ncbi:hypothetical protein LZG74_19895 [Dyadobacter sp. CY327]|uniref:hypothetical protein n=1 Tax=Dyadobacter sp. CY327 TaxID=2907301 RepID=UPI001F3B04CD|nr:hypothetical protein [Dyadobacter sp. CY327]MCE7072588.1 hypothetical protein [Dyadobacter sp. CY327]